MPRTAIPARKLIPLADAAEYANVSVKTLRRWVITGRLTGHRVGPKLIKIDQADLDAIIKPIAAAGGRTA